MINEIQNAEIKGNSQSTALLETLYKTTATGAIQTWRVDVQGNSYTVTHGQQGGKLQTKTTVCTAKNIGKANETTPTQQALLEAKALHTKQIDRKGYTLEIGGKSASIRPMLARNYRNVSHQITETDKLILSPKLDGVRALWIQSIGKFQTRGGKFHNVPHLEQALKDCSLLLDGEIYLHGVDQNRINGATQKTNELTAKLEFHVFDCVDSELQTSERLELIENYLNENPIDGVALVQQLAGTKADIKPTHDRFVSEGFEGVIIRREGAYLQGQRPDSLFKYKEFDDAEFIVVGIELDKDGGGTLQCDGFNVRMRGTDSDRKHIAENPHEYIGKLLTVRYFAITEYGKPYCPVGITIRHDIEGGAL
jgi:DNA ligase-1